MSTPELGLGALPPQALGFAVALGAGLLIGLDRERRKGRGPDRRAAGIRTFTVAALGGALAQALALPWVVVLGAALVGSLAVVAYARSHSQDPGLTTELALFVTYLIGVLAMRQPALGAGLAAIVAALLAKRELLHRFATDWLSEGELHDAVLLAALVLVVLPLTPADPVPWLGGLEPRRLMLIGALILALQAAGHVASRVAGARAGMALAGLFSGFVSSTATIASLGARARREPAIAAGCEAGAMLSTAATWVQALLLLAVLAPSLALALAPAALAAAAVAAATGAWRARQAPDGATEASDADRVRGPLRLREAGLLATLLVGVSLGVGWAQRWLGDAGVFAGAAVGALADAHASVAALANLLDAGQVAPPSAALGVLIAVTTNAASRCAVAAAAGGTRYALRVGLSLAASTAAGWAVAALGGTLAAVS